MKRWMYVYLAVGVYTYDLLHIALYPYNTRDSAHAFLLAVRGRGYHPRIVVTNLRRDYGLVIAQVFPQARHHQCLFHAGQEMGRYLCKTWGRDYRFDQHYQNFCGFESLQSAQLYLGVFEKVYRFTPFSDDAQPGIRGKSPLQLAGYDLSRIPMTWLCRGFSLDWPLTAQSIDVPHS